MQAMTKFMEQGLHFVVCQQRRVVAGRRGKIANQIGDWRLDVISDFFAAHAIVHPGAATLFGAGV